MRTVDVGGRKPVFRLQVDALVPQELAYSWDPAVDLAVPSVIRPQMPGTHYNFLRMVTPEDFRAGVLYPSGLDLLSFFRLLGGELNERARRLEEEKVRRRVKEEHAAFKKAHGIP